jgi:hypothetical protein
MIAQLYCESVLGQFITNFWIERNAYIIINEVIWCRVYSNPCIVLYVHYSVLPYIHVLETMFEHQWGAPSLREPHTSTKPIQNYWNL